MKRLLAAALLCAACSCKEKKTEAPPPVLERPSDDWLRGTLPKEVSEGTPVSGGTLVVRVYTEPPGLNFVHDQMAEGWMTKYTKNFVYECLAELDRDTPRYELKPLLAEKWESSDDHLTDTIHLRHGVKFHDGSPFSAKDVRATLEAILNEKNLTVSARSYFDALAGFTTPDEYTVVMKWKRPYFLALRNFLANVPIFPAKALEGDFNTMPLNRAPIGTGPFKFVSWETGKAITFKRNDAYWGQKPYLDGYVIRLVKDHTVATQLWEKGEFDVMTLVQPPVWRAIEEADPKNAWAQKGYHRIRFQENSYSWIGWNEERPVFKDARVRNALGMLFPYEQVSKNIDLDLETPTTCPYYVGSDSCDPSVKRLRFDPDGAAKLLDEAGWKLNKDSGAREKDGGALKFTMMVTPHSVKLGKLAPLLQEEYRKVGIDMDIEKVETAVYVERMRKHEFDAGSLFWTSLDPVMDNYQIFHSSQASGGSNYVSYKNDDVDRALESIRTEFDADKRAELERKVHRQLYADQVYNFLTNRPSLDAVKTNVRGIKPSLVWYDLRKIWIAPTGVKP